MSAWELLVLYAYFVLCAVYLFYVVRLCIRLSINPGRQDLEERSAKKQKQDD